jgi:hypothetical protein
MDEGAVVAYPERVLEGAVPHRDFLTFYGPGNLWIIAGAFLVFDESIETERAVGLMYRLLIVLALFVLGLRIAGLAGGLLAGFAAAMMLGAELIWAYASYGALALALVGLAVTTSAVGARADRETLGLAVGGGLAGGAALVRFDFAPAIVLAAIPLLTLASRRGRLAFGAGFAASAVVYAVHLVLVGPERIGRVAGDLIASGPGRELPIPPLSDYPGNLLLLSIVVAISLVPVGAVLWRRRHDDIVPRLIVALGLFDLALMPYALSRADVSHIRPVAVVPISVLPAIVLYLIRTRIVREPLRTGVTVGVVVVAAAAILSYSDLSIDRLRQVNDVRDAYRGFEGDDTRVATQAVVARVRELARPGDSIFAGPQDLRRTNYGPTYLYFELNEFEPASYYMEMNPGTANREGSGFADELRRADWLILTSAWDSWDEPNESREYGPDEPNQVVRDDFCLRLERGQYRLYERCDRAA